MARHSVSIGAKELHKSVCVAGGGGCWAPEDTDLVHWHSHAAVQQPIVAMWGYSPHIVKSVFKESRNLGVYVKSPSFLPRLNLLHKVFKFGNSLKPQF